ncbi:carboxypeptidase A5-like, partial [Actinia tenebrosa]|uniref:Carboxypeptidase A5-like n=1 Tax=Actinia tenebrosa TaxID=6105 RepID=A0A6P8J8V1_ACTTE
MLMALLRLLLFCNIFTLSSSDKVLRVVPSTVSQLKLMTAFNDIANKIDFWRFPSTVGQAIDFHVTDKDYHLLHGLLRHWGFNVKVQISDLKRLIDVQRKESIEKRQVKSNNARMADFCDDYHSLHEINNELHSIADRYSKFTTALSIGKSYENRDILAIQIQGKFQVNKPLFFIQCGIHAREWISPATCMYIIDKMTSSYIKDSMVTAFLDKMDIIVLPVINVDGYEYTWTNDRLWRKNRRQQKNSFCIGVDLNRNFGNAWGGSGSSCDPCHGTYQGSKPFSEPETLSVKTLLESLGSRLQGF